MYIPSELGYGDSGSPPKIKGGDPLIFQMEIIKINGGKKPAMTCDPATLQGCNEKETAFVEKFKTATPDAIAAELKRLGGMNTKSMKPELFEWLARRKAILERMGKDEL
jgi:hypothetical protein